MSSQKTEAPTPKRIFEARKKGQVARSRELAAAATLLAGAVIFTAIIPALVRALATFGNLVWTNPGVAPLDALDAGIESVAMPLLLAVGLVPLLVALVIFVQFKPGFFLQSVMVRWERIQPIEGMKKLFSLRSLYEVAKSLVLIIAIGALAYALFQSAAPGVMRLARADVEASWTWVGAEVLQFLWSVVPIVVFVGVADLMYQKWRHLEDLKMSRDEVKREHREAEGDPEAKAARNRAYQELVAHAALEAVRSADVLVVNPTHVAVALRYDQEDEEAAPEVVARGQDHLAKRMIEAAQDAGVPVMRDVPLARALYLLELGEEIPEALFEAVAEVLQAAWRMREQEEAEAGASGEEA